MTDGDDDILIVSARGQAARFTEAAVRPMGRQTRGVKAMNLDAGDRVLALCVARDDEDLLVVTGNGFGKRTPMSDYPRKGRPTKGVRTIKVTDRKGELVTARPVREGHQLLLVSLGGQVIRIDVGSVRRTGRSTEGVRLMVMSDDDQIATVAAVLDHDDADVDAADEATEPSPDARDTGVESGESGRRARLVGGRRQADTCGRMAAARALGSLSRENTPAPSSIPREGGAAGNDVHVPVKGVRPARMPLVDPEVHGRRCRPAPRGRRMSGPSMPASARPGRAGHSGACRRGAMRTAPESGGACGHHAVSGPASAIRAIAGSASSVQIGHDGRALRTRSRARQAAAVRRASRSAGRGSAAGTPPPRRPG